MKLRIFLTCVLTPMAYFCLGQAPRTEKTAFQTGSAWRPEIDVRSDIAIVYGAGDRKNMTFEQRVQSWRDHGYQTHFMTGIAWGEYQDYFLGKWDGKNHQEIGQMERDGKVILAWRWGALHCTRTVFSGLHENRDDQKSDRCRDQFHLPGRT